MKIDNQFITVNKYSRPGIKMGKITKIAIHYVGNTGSSAINNRNYFQNLATTKLKYASSHFIIGLGGEIIGVVPETEIAYCTNSANSYALSVEFCHPKEDGKPLESTRNSLIELCAHLCSKYNLNPLNDLIRHFDVTGKDCPRYYVKNKNEWEQLKKDLYTYMHINKNMNTYIDKLVELKIIASPDFWKDPTTKKDKYLNALIINIGNYFSKSCQTYEDAIELLEEKGAIKSPDFWLNPAKDKTPYLEEFLANVMKLF